VAENDANSTDQTESKKSDSLMDDLKANLEKAKNDFLYLRAEFDTYKRNAIKERSDLQKYGAEKVLVDLLGVLDNFERALSVKVTPESLPTFITGVEMTCKDIRGVLTKYGVVEIPSHGEAFNPMHHEALSSEETGEIPEGHVSRVFRKPYKLYDRVIRPGQVVVAKKPAGN
jgi:molecular chaperone GrpE